MSETAAVAEQELSYDEAVAEFLDYVKEYRSFSQWTVRAYGTDLRLSLIHISEPTRPY